MKQLITRIAVGLMLMSFAFQTQRDILLAQFYRLVCEWEGLMEYTSYEDNTTKHVTPAKCESTFDGKAWLYKVTYDEGNGQIFEGSGECIVSQDGSQVMYNGIKWNVVSIQESADTVRILMETKGKDNRKKASLRQTLEVTDRTFTLTEEVKYDSGGDYFVRNKHLFRKRR